MKPFTLALRIAALAGTVLLWHGLATRQVHLGLITFTNVPPPLEVLDAAWVLLHNPKLVQHLLSSLTRAFVAYFALGHCHNPAIRAGRPADPTDTTPMTFRGSWESDAFMTLLRNTIAYGVGV